MSVFMRLFALCLPLALAAPLAAQDRSARFLQLMSHLPDPVIANRSPHRLEFVDRDAEAAVMAALAAGGEVEAGGRRTMGGAVERAPQGTDWTGTVGFSREDLRAFAASDYPEDPQMVLLLPPEVMPGIGPALLANGYAVDESKGFRAFWRGVEDLSIDLANRNPDDPFASPLPRSSRIALEGELLFQSAAWPALEAMVASDRTNPVLTAFGDVLDLPDWGARRLVQATVFSDPTAFSSGLRLDQNLNPLDAPSGGVPYWSNLMLADLSDGVSDLTLVVLIYPSKSDAALAVETLQEKLALQVLSARGQDRLGDLTGPGRAMVSGDGPYAAIYVVETLPKVMTPGLVGNRGYDIFMAAALSRDLPLLGPLLP